MYENGKPWNLTGSLEGRCGGVYLQGRVDVDDRDEARYEPAR